MAKTNSRILKTVVVVSAVIAVFFGIWVSANSASTFSVQQGGTGSTTAPLGQVLYAGASGSTPDGKAYQSRATTTLIAGSNVSFGGATPVILGDSPITISATGGGGGGSGTVGTSSSETANRIPYWTTTSATPALLSGGSANLTYDGTLFQVGGVPAFTPSTPDIAIFNTNQDAYGAVTISNKSATANASADLVFANGNTINNAVYYADCGLNSNQYTNVAYPGFAQPNQFYCYNTDGPMSFFAASTTGPSYISFGTKGTAAANERVRIDSAGKVGIGTTSPYAQLSVNAPGGTAPYFAIGSTTGEVLNISPSVLPLVGIGTTSPFKTLSVVGDTWIDSTSATALTVGSAGAKSLVVDSSAGVGSGIAIVTNVAASGVTIIATSTGTNEALTVSGRGSGGLNLSGGSGGNIFIQPAGATRYSFLSSSVSFAPTNNVTAAGARFGFTGAADTTLTAATEAPSTYFNMGQIRSHSSGAIATQRDFRITPSTHQYTAGTAAANATIGSSSALSIDGPPTQGVNVNYTNAQGLFIGPGTRYTPASTTNAFGLVIVGPAGAATSGAALLVGTTSVWGNVGIGLSATLNALTVAVGSVSLPSISFGDATTGLFRSAANAIGFAISGVEKFTLNATGAGVASTTPWSNFAIGGAAGTWPFAIGSSTGTSFGVNDYGTVVLTANQPATSTAITLDWSKTGQQVEYRIGASATTITLINATTSQYWGTTKRVWVCNPGSAAGALTWAGVEWLGSAPTQTTTLNQCDLYSFNITRATSTSAYKVAGAASTGFQ